MTKYLQHLTFGIILLLAYLPISYCAEAIVLGENMGIDRPVTLLRNMEVLLDPSNRLTIDDVQKPPFASAFIPHGVPRSHPTFTNGTVWVRFSLAREASATDDWVIQLYPTWLDEIRVYTGVYREARLVMVLGDQHPFSERALKTNLPAFPVSLGTTPQKYYLQIRTRGPMPLAFNVWREDSLEQRDMQHASVSLVLSGAAIVLIFVFLIFWGRIQDPIYAAAALLIGSAMLAAFALQGYGSSLCFPRHALWADRSVDIAICFFAASFGFSICRLVELRSHFARATRVLDGFAIFFAFIIPFVTLGLLDPLRWWLITLFGVLLAAINILLIRLIARLKKRKEQLVVAMFILVIIIGIFRLSILQGLVPAAPPYLERPILQYLQAAILMMVCIVAASRFFTIESQRRAERQKAYESMRIASQAVEDRSRQREFVKVISNEFRMPLVIANEISLELEDSLSGKDDRVRSSAMKIRQAIQRLVGLIENLLIDDALESGRGLRENDLFDMRGALVSVQNNCLPQDSERLDFNIPDAALIFRGSRSGVEILLWNIIQNALKYSSSKVKVNCRIERDQVILDIVNYGNPISKSEQGRLFDRYIRGAQSLGVPGSGLGLHISRSLALQHGGDVNLVSSDAGGTIFRISLPLEVGAEFVDKATGA
ncbi:hypothetical protein CKY39_07710 [Variovorax boronicumulans]|uniref:histidine kinase n=1 Tax=Variovorax boronicumulans TaxID=436515 RepID=A0A250DFU0_9BURK|nr:sensor histidine kinase [Variovorax boronicumulans]ATA53112.1 hypothetical protein CKY39_07710 [Variovorax boronicumulans]